ncbi:MAG: IS200/IS605 family transposase [Sarcina sp.]
MKDVYRRTKTTVSLINYHFVFCPRYRRKIFKINGLEERFNVLVKEICEQNGIVIVAMECHIDHVHLFVNSPPTLAPSDIMQKIKGTTSRIIRKEFIEVSRIPSLWTRSYFVSTAGNASSETVQKYVEEQKTR